MMVSFCLMGISFQMAIIYRVSEKNVTQTKAGNRNVIKLTS